MQSLQSSKVILIAVLWTGKNVLVEVESLSFSHSPMACPGQVACTWMQGSRCRYRLMMLRTVKLYAPRLPHKGPLKPGLKTQILRVCHTSYLDSPLSLVVWWAVRMWCHQAWLQLLNSINQINSDRWNKECTYSVPFMISASKMNLISKITVKTTEFWNHKHGYVSSKKQHKSSQHRGRLSGQFWNNLGLWWFIPRSGQHKTIHDSGRIMWWELDTAHKSLTEFWLGEKDSPSDPKRPTISQHKLPAQASGKFQNWWRS